MNVGELQEKRSGSVKATANMFSERVRDAKPALKKVPGSHSERPSSRRREKANLARGENGVGWSNESGGGVDEESMMKEAEVLVAKSKVNNDLNSRIEQSNSRARAQMEYLEKLKKSRRGEGRRSKSYPSVEVMEELEIVKRELNNLKLEMASLLEEKRRAEKETEASNLKARSCSTAAEALKGEIEEINEEHVLAELARIEAIREYGTIKSQRKNDAEKHAGGRAAGAEEIADKKVAAAQAWIEALKASEKEILIKIEMAKKENGELRIEEEQQVNRMQRQSFSTKERVESEPETRWQNREKAKLSRTKSANRNGNFTPSRRGKTRKSASPALRGTPRSASFTVKRRTKVMPNLAKFFSGNGKSSKEQK